MSTERVQLWDGWIDLGTRQVHRGVEDRLTPMEWRLLVYLVERAGRVCSWSALRDQVWRYSPRTTTRTYTATAHRLRRKVEANPSKPRHLRTVYGAGLCFIPVAPDSVQLDDLALENRRLRALCEKLTSSELEEAR